MHSKLQTASWILLALVGALTIFVSFVSANLGYRGDYPIGGLPIAEVAAGREGLLTALRGIRGTSAAFGAAYGVLFLSTVLGPYRRGEARAWWTLFLALLVMVAIVLARMPLLGIAFGEGGTGLAITLGGITLFALLLGAGRLRNS